MGDQLCLSRLVTRCGRSDKAWMGQMFAEGKRRGRLPAALLSVTRAYNVDEKKDS